MPRQIPSVNSVYPKKKHWALTLSKEGFTAFRCLLLVPKYLNAPRMCGGIIIIIVVADIITFSHLQNSIFGGHAEKQGSNNQCGVEKEHPPRGNTKQQQQQQQKNAWWVYFMKLKTKMKAATSMVSSKLIFSELSVCDNFFAGDYSKYDHFFCW